MSKHPSHIDPLPASLRPAKSSTQLINEHVERLRAAGTPQKVIALSLGFGPNYVSMLKAGEELPLPRILAFAAAARLSDAERRELLHTRLMELHGNSGQICVETLAHWAEDLCAPIGDEAALLTMWREATAPAPWMLMELLKDPRHAARVQAVFNEITQEELRACADYAATP